MQKVIHQKEEKYVKQGEHQLLKTGQDRSRAEDEVVYVEISNG
jgi:hypothetical protein